MSEMIRRLMARSPEVSIPDSPYMVQPQDPGELDFFATTGRSTDMPSEEELAGAGQEIKTYTDPFTGDLQYHKPEVAGTFADWKTGGRKPMYRR